MPHTARFGRLPTEQSNPRSHNLDHLSIPKLLRLMNREDSFALRAVKHELPKIAQAVRLITKTLQSGGRLFFVGAGTSGRLGVLEAAECPPTFHTKTSVVQAIMAGGRGAVFRSLEGSEDDRKSARRKIRERVRAGDLVVGIAASGITPFVSEALKASARSRAKTVLITCHPTSPIRVHTRITLNVGPEVLTGSTRLKAGTATKLVLNMLTLAAMVQLGKTYGNLMVDVRPTSRKLKARALSIIRSLTGCSEQAAAQALRTACGQPKVAILMIRKNLSAQAARRRLVRAGNSLHRTLK